MSASRTGTIAERPQETPAEFAWRIGVPVKTVYRKIKRPDCPQNFIAHEGPTGRIVRLQASPELEHFMRTDPRKL